MAVKIKIGQKKQGFTENPVTEISADKENRNYFFVVSSSKKTERFQDTSFKRLSKKRDEIILKLKETSVEKFLKSIPREDIKVLKKSLAVKKVPICKTPIVSGNIELLQLRRKIILEARLKGLSDLQIQEIVSQEFDVSPQRVVSEILKVEEEIRQCAIVSHEEILLSHTERYEYLYSKFREDGFDPYALRALKNKESILGLHDQTVNIQVNNYIGSEFDTRFLSPEKKERLIELLSKINVI